LEEEKRFRATLDRGLAMLEEEYARLAAAGQKVIPGKTVFKLYDTFGFPDDLTEIDAAEHGFTVDQQGFAQELTAAQERSKFEVKEDEQIAGAYKALAGEVGATRFLGHEGRGTTGEGTVRAILVDGARVPRAEAGAK